MPLTRPQADELCDFAEEADRETRDDLVAGYVRGEDDYTSQFTVTLRRRINAQSTTGLRATSYLLPVRRERQMGCDAAVLISGRDATKTAPFEAKLPGVARGKTRWDYRQGTGGNSHFSGQLDKQKSFVPGFAVFEMFYLDWPFGAQPSHLPDEGSACVWHDEAVAFDGVRGSAPGPWSHAELDTLLHRQALTIRDVLEAVCQCAAGEAISWVPSGAGEVATFAKELGLEGLILHIESAEEGE